ncbi:MAG: alpha-ketoglutarate-dependent dioxygenase AlkB [Myxococcota bacterium]
MPRRELGGGAWIDVEPWLPDEVARDLHGALVDELEWSQRPIVVFGREVLQPRLIAWAGDRPYRYSGQVLPAQPFGPVLDGLRRRVEERTSLTFDHVLLNRYRDGQDHMGMHADDEPELGEDPQIAALSLGARRRFVIEPKPKKLRKRRLSFSLESGSLMVMGGRMQHSWRHGVPKQASVENERVNVTFRLLRYDPGMAPRRDSRRARGRTA